VHPEVSKARATVAALTRCVKHGERSPEELLVAKDRLNRAKISATIDKLIAEAPPLNAEQRTRLAELLKPVRLKPDSLAPPGSSPGPAPAGREAV